MSKMEKQTALQQTSPKRMANLEMLRCLAMIMVVVLHYLGKGNLLTDLTQENLGTTGMIAWLLESFCIVAVNVYMLISGYFLCMSSFQPAKLIKLYLQLWVYSVGIGLLAVVTGILPPEEFTIHYLLTLLFPVSMEHYWFMTAYIYLYLLLPFIGSAVKKMTKKQMQVALSVLLLVFCVLKSVLPVRLEMDAQGYDCLWYLCVFFTAAYIRKFGIAFLEKKRNCICLYIVSCFGVFLEIMCFRQVYLHTGALDRILKVSLEYNHIFPFLGAIGLFGIFKKIKISGKLAEIVNRFGVYTLGVYLLHENIGVRTVWSMWFGAEKVSSWIELLCCTFIAVFVVFLLGIFVDKVREKIFGAVHQCLMKITGYKKLQEKIQEANNFFVEAKTMQQ